MNLLFVLSFLLAISGITPYDLENNIQEYFKSGVIRRATKVWQRYMVAFENALSAAIKESYGFKGLNIYVRKPINPLHVGTGYYHTDNQVHLVLQDMNLEEFPHLADPLVRFPLLSNVLKVEAIASRMNIIANFIQFRNTSNIAYGLIDQDSYKMSPFLFEQVRNVGQLAITVEGCKVSGIGIASLIGRTVTLGNTVFRLLNCHFNFEIFTPGMAAPPVIADYLPNSEGFNLEHLIMKPLQAELFPKMQALLQTYINTSSIFKESLGELRTLQSQVFEKVSNYVNTVIKNLNILTIKNNMGKIEMEDFSIRWNDTFEDGVKDSTLNLRNMVITGLETVYSSQTGGPFKLTSLKISDELRYGTLQVRGSVDMQVGDSTKGMYEFAVEISDVSVDVTVNLERKANDTTVPARSIHVIEVMGWRSAQFSSPGMTLKTGEAFIIGYLQTKVPIYLANHLNQLLGRAVEETEKDPQSLDPQGLDAAAPNEVLGNGPDEVNQPMKTNIYDENAYEENYNINNGDDGGNQDIGSNGDDGGNEDIGNNYNNEDNQDIDGNNPDGFGYQDGEGLDNVDNNPAPSDLDGDMGLDEVATEEVEVLKYTEEGNVASGPSDGQNGGPSDGQNGGPSDGQNGGPDGQTLQAKFFDENMFAMAVNPDNNKNN